MRNPIYLTQNPRYRLELTRDFISLRLLCQSVSLKPHSLECDRQFDIIHGIKNDYPYLAQIFNSKNGRQDNFDRQRKNC